MLCVTIALSKVASSDDCAQESVPFAVSSSVQLIEVKGRKVRGRLYPWGVVEVENPEHGDFIKLRTMLMCVGPAL